jgi:hypothetical protein
MPIMRSSISTTFGVAVMACSLLGGTGCMGLLGHAVGREQPIPSAPEVYVPNPLGGGADLPASRIVHAYNGDSERRQMPDGSLASEAVITSADASRVCLDFLLRRVRPEGTFKPWPLEFALRVTDGPTVDSPEVKVSPATQKEYEGLVAHHVMGTTWTEHNVVGPGSGTIEETTHDVVHVGQDSTEWEPGTVVVDEQTYSMCFANGGVLTPATRDLVLEIKTLGVRRIAYRWGFGQAPPPGPPSPWQRARMQRARTALGACTSPAACATGSHVVTPRTESIEVGVSWDAPHGEDADCSDHLTKYTLDLKSHVITWDFCRPNNRNRGMKALSAKDAASLDDALGKLEVVASARDCPADSKDIVLTTKGSGTSQYRNGLCGNVGPAVDDAAMTALVKLLHRATGK